MTTKRKVKPITAAGVLTRAQPASVVDEIAAERRRQIKKERWTTKHDDQHTDGGLALAAACYASLAAVHAQHRTRAEVYANAEPPFRWPWEREWWKPKNPRRDLIRAAALIVAEIERLDRASPAVTAEQAHDIQPKR